MPNYSAEREDPFAFKENQTEVEMSTMDNEGMQKYQHSLELYYQRKLDEAEKGFKETLSIFKKEKQDMTISYNHVLSRLAHTCFLDFRFSEAKKYFEVARQIAPEVTENEQRIYITH